MQEWFQNLFAATLGLGDLGITVGLVVSVIVKIVIILIPLILTVAYLTYFERKVIGFMQLRVGPNVTGPRGLIQPFADVFKLLFKEVTRPKLSNKALFYIGPIMSLAPSFAAWAVIPFNEEWVLTNINIGLLYILMITSLSVYGVIIAGWASNSKYSFLGAMRAFRAKHFLRDCHECRAGVRCDGIGQHELLRHRCRAGKRHRGRFCVLVELAAAVPNLHRLSDFRRCRNQPRTV